MLARGSIMKGIRDAEAWHNIVPGRSDGKIAETVEFAYLQTSKLLRELLPTGQM